LRACATWSIEAVRTTGRARFVPLAQTFAGTIVRAVAGAIRVV
jgi:hypothetical protein